jgi:hypothetical protein
VAVLAAESRTPGASAAPMKWFLIHLRLCYRFFTGKVKVGKSLSE